MRSFHIYIRCLVSAAAQSCPPAPLTDRTGAAPQTSARAAPPRGPSRSANELERVCEPLHAHRPSLAAARPMGDVKPDISDDASVTLTVVDQVRAELARGGRKTEQAAHVDRRVHSTADARRGSRGAIRRICARWWPPRERREWRRRPSAAAGRVDGRTAPRSRRHQSQSTTAPNPRRGRVPASTWPSSTTGAGLLRHVICRARHLP